MGRHAWQGRAAWPLGHQETYFDGLCVSKLAVLIGKDAKSSVARCNISILKSTRSVDYGLPPPFTGLPALSCVFVRLLRLSCIVMSMSARPTHLRCNKQCFSFKCYSSAAYTSEGASNLLWWEHNTTEVSNYLGSTTGHSSQCCIYVSVIASALACQTYR